MSLWIYINRSQYILDEELLANIFAILIRVFYVLEFSLRMRRVTKKYFAMPDVEDLSNWIIASIVDLMSYSSYILNTFKILVKN